MRRGIALAEVSATNMQRDLKKYMREYFEFPRFCDEVWEAVLASPGRFMSKRAVYREFGRNQRWGNELDRVITHLVRAGRLEWCGAAKTHNKGPATEGWRALEDEGVGI
jgi:hypothetical protein